MTDARSALLRRITDSCDARHVRNPRTGRCVLKTKPLGRALVALAHDLQAGKAPKACSRRGAAWDPATEQCVTDSRAQSLRVLAEHWAEAEAINAGRRPASANANAPALRRRVAELEAEVAELRLALAEAQGRSLRNSGEAAQLRRNRNALQRQLNSSLQLRRQLEAAMLA